MSLRESLSSCWSSIQDDLFPWLEETVGPLSGRHQQLVTVLEMARIEALVPHWHGLAGRPPAERTALARAFAAKAVFNLPTTSMLIERLRADKILRRLCGWERASEISSESTFSRAFAEFAASAVPLRVHEALIAQTHTDRLVGHIARDSTAITAREKPAKLDRPPPAGQAKRRWGRPGKARSATGRRPGSSGSAK